MSGSFFKKEQTMKPTLILTSAVIALAASSASANCTLDDQFAKAQEFTAALQIFVQADPSQGATLAIRQSKLIQEATATGDANAICDAYDILLAEIDTPAETPAGQTSASCDDTAVRERSTAFLTAIQTLASANQEKAKALMEQSQEEIAAATSLDDPEAVCAAYDGLIAQASE